VDGLLASPDEEAVMKLKGELVGAAVENELAVEVAGAAVPADANENGMALSPSDVVGLNENAGAADVVTAAVDAASDFSV
jgi:hypothetical protein